MLPAIGQGALGIDLVDDEIELLTLLSKVHNDEVAKCVTAERTFLAEMDGRCQVPIAGYATISDQKEIEFTGLIITQMVKNDLNIQ